MAKFIQPIKSNRISDYHIKCIDEANKNDNIN